MEVVEIEWLAEKCVNQETAALHARMFMDLSTNSAVDSAVLPPTVLGSHSAMIWCSTVSKLVYHMIQQPLKVLPCSLSGSQPVELLYPQSEEYWTQPCTQKQQPHAKIQTWVTTVQWKCHQRTAKGWGSGVSIYYLSCIGSPSLWSLWIGTEKPKHYLSTICIPTWLIARNQNAVEPWDSLV